MPGVQCAVAICSNTYYKTKDRSDGVSYFRFPKKDKLRNVWIDRCKRKDSLNPDTSYICSDHFKEEDFIRNLKAELMGSKQKKFIHPEAIPSVKLLPTENCKLDTSRGKRREKKERNEIVSKLLKTNEPDIASSSEGNPPCSLDADEESKTMDYKVEYVKLKAAYEAEKIQGNDKIAALEEENRRLREERKESVQKELTILLKGIFTTTQIEQILKKKKKVNCWTSEDITKAFTIRYLSKRCYIYLRNDMNIPLPCLTTLKKWASKIYLKNGVLQGVLDLMKVAAINLTEIEKIVVLQFDEMKVMALYEYEPVLDKVVGPHSQVQVVMARSLFSSWKQPIFIDFDMKMTRKCLDNLIQKLFEIGFTVRAIVSDCGGGNVGVWKEYGVNHNQSWYLSDVTSKNIYFLADVPHLLKLIRNWLLDVGFILEDGTFVSSGPIKALVNQTQNIEISSCHRLTPKHVNCEKFERQNVKLAAQVMSNTTACALRRYDVDDAVKRHATADFIQHTNDWFDIMNSRVPNTSIDLQCGYGIKLEKQKEKLIKYMTVIENMKCVNKKSLQIFQKGVIMSTKSIISMFDDLKIDMGITYILTSKLNQDSLENFFSLVRSGGGLNDHPTPLECIYRMRMIVLGKNTGRLRTNTNTKETRDEFLLGQVLKKSCVNVGVIKYEEDDTLKEDEEDQEHESAEKTEKEKLKVETNVSSDGLSYIAGWMAKRLRRKYPNLGNYTYKQDKTTTWISELSVGGLTEPTREFNTAVSKMETLFNKFTKGSVPRCVGVKAKLSKKVHGHMSTIPFDIVELFVRRRIVMRLKYLNKQTKNDGKQKKSKKIKKVVL